MENLEEPEKRSCAVCARVLHVMVGETTGETYWVHAEMDWADHPAVPVEQDEVQTAYRCDFCSTDDPAWVLPTNSFASGEFEIVDKTFDTASGKNFACCELCVQLIEKNQWNALVRRVAKIMIEKHGLEGEAARNIEPGLKDFYRRLRKNITGAPRPLEEGV